MKPRILITGANGQLGWELSRAFSETASVCALERKGLDLTEPNSIREGVRNFRPDLIINAAAYTAVDRAEAEPDLAHQVNAEGPRVLAEEAKRAGAVLIHYSTDYVFDGTASEPYTEDSPPAPLSCYGRTKLEGDRAIESIGGAYLIFRTSWVYGARGKNFFLTMLKLAEEREELQIVDDQYGAPTWSRDIAEATRQAVSQVVGNLNGGSFFQHLQPRSGIYNMTAAGMTTWFGFAEAILRRSGHDRKLRLLPIPSSQYPTAAVRPQWSALSGEKLRKAFGVAFPHWETSLAGVFAASRLD